MREIKFRAWHKLANIMCFIDMLDFMLDAYRARAGKRSGSGHLADIELMQYTGLKDKNGKEIYGGDIVNYLEMSLTVAWSDTLARPILRPYTIAHHYDLNADVAEECEVVGNIYETPELMPKEDKE